MKKLTKILVFSILAVFLIGGTAMAYVYTYPDIYANWPNTFPVNVSSDTHGTPLIGDATITTSVIGDTEYLDSISINVTDRRVWDALFINTSDFNETAWEAWDYIVYESDNGAGGTNPYTLDQMPVSTEGIYSVNDSYDYVHVDYSGGRVGHVNGIEGDYVTASTIGYSVSYASNVLTYNFDSGEIALGDDWGIGYTPWCANDVYLTPIPEPATMLLLGSGLLGLAVLGRKKLFKKS